jgi:hypothetical protein
MEFVGNFMLYHHTKLHVPRSSSSLVVSVKPKANRDFIWSPSCFILHKISGLYIKWHCHCRSLHDHCIGIINDKKVVSVHLF